MTHDLLTARRPLLAAEASAEAHACGTEPGDLEQAVRPRLLEALLSPGDLTYREFAGQLGISQGSLGPERSRCLGCLRCLLAPEVAARQARG
ncbi:hypothetical protein C1I97_15695 [Streptomyces sp. NTH33]|uniref:hypothetical protein n=1 Tax=Streptomyces sp. NTH33 TaxID=1735453 RepID=UPI000DA8E970|nr:hypothetical protein [Streptomyces sp. NTH33]PZH08651.1 hypothetical protein C1I97_15695 [Streptomyces sp. NTH33]